MQVHSATCSCSVELYEQWYTLADFFPNWDISRGFLYITLISQNTPPAHTVIFAVFFYCSPERSEKLRCAGRGSGDIIFHSLGRRGIIVIQQYTQSTKVYAPSSELAPPPPSSGSQCVSPLGSKGGEQHSIADQGAMGPNSDDWIEGLALCILSGLGGRVERKKPFTRAARVRQISFIFGIRKKAAMLRWGAAGGARSALFGVAMSPKRRVRAAHWRARAAKTHQQNRFIFPSTTIYRRVVPGIYEL